ncbi:DUF2971 domain-containing protein [Oceanospirillum maris]|uniref:DUF2971 domain-containing protein n=1 Tax=Oceanospirillum maris TaxID=64977 RepID=UPI00041DCF55|nr:DUF2971 domain-containing protein [Oceanospirillum maris]
MADDLLYHYTSIGGLKGMLDSQSLWMTDINYLNDSEEGKDFIAHINNFLCQSDFEQIVEKSKLWSLIKDLDFIRSAIIEFASPDFFDEAKLDSYSISFSAKPDLLSQWRGYCPPEGGLCLGFSGLESISSISGYEGDDNSDEYYIYHSSCLYGEHEKNAATINFINSYLDLIYNIYLRGVNDRKYKPNIDEMFEIFTFYFNNLTIFKNKHFMEESEFRIIANCKREIVNPNFREKMNILIPYIKLNFNTENLKRIIIGPCADQALAEQSLQRFLGSFGSDFEHVKIECSDIPYRQL